MVTPQALLPTKKIVDHYIGRVSILLFVLLPLQHFSSCLFFFLCKKLNVLELTMTYFQTFQDDDLTRTHPTFLWAFRASRNWPVVKDLIPFMRNRLESEQAAIQKHVLSHGVVMNKETELQTDFDTLFKQLFCVSAQELSNDLRYHFKNWVHYTMIFWRPPFPYLEFLVLWAAHHYVQERVN